jgi:hypothetical protein
MERPMIDILINVLFVELVHQARKLAGAIRQRLSAENSHHAV